MPTFVGPAAVDVEALGVSSAEATWLGRPAAHTLEGEARRARMKLGPSQDVVTLTPGAVATADALKRFVQASDGVTGDVVGRLADPLAPWSDEPCFGPPARLVRLRGGGELTPERLAAASSLVVTPEHRTLDVKVADRPGGRQVQLDLSDAVLCSMHHWSGVLWANLLALGPTLWRELVGPIWWAPFRIGWAAARAASTDPFLVAGRLNRVERGARVHPSAVVEGSWIGPGANVGPCAVVRGSVLGPGARVEPQALVGFSVLGGGAVVQRRGWIQYGIVHPEAAVGGAMQLGVLGPRASFKHGSYLMDQSISSTVRASTAGELHPAPLGVLGVGVGADSVVASGVWVAPGRTLPPHTSIVPSASVLATPPPAGGGLTILGATR